MSQSSAHRFERVSRVELAQNPIVWWAVRGLVGLYAFIALLLAFVPAGYASEAMVAFAICGACSLSLLRGEPPPIGSVRNHLVLAMVTGTAAVAVVSFQPGGIPAIAIVSFIGPLTAVRLLDRRQIAAHYTAATVLLLAPVVLGLVDGSTFRVVLAVLPVIWGLGACCVVVLEAAEAQGEQLERLLRRDPLTGVGNRRLLDERLAYELARHRRSGRPLSILAFDLDGFKALNDTVGHAAGDELLCEVADVLAAAVRASDTVVRQGGDEFCVLLAETGAVAAGSVAGMIRLRLASIESHGVAIGTGVGIATFPDDGERPGVLLAVADARLREDKAEGDARQGRRPRAA